MTQQKPSIVQLKQFRPLDTFSEKQMVLLAANASIKHYLQDQTIVEIGNHDRMEYFLLKGCVELESVDGRFKRVDAGSESARAAVALLQPRKYTVKTVSPCTFIIITQNTVNTLLNEMPQDKSVDFSVTDLHSGHEIKDIAHSFESDLKSNNLQMPSFPDVALRIRTLLDDPNITVKDIAKVLNNDPAMTVKLLKTCNSPLYRTASEITSCADAIVRLGFDTTKQLVTIFAMKELFNSKNQYLQNKMRELWLRSREVASIAYVLAKITPRLNPEHAMLAGLIQDIGTIPVLNYIERYPHFMKLDYKVDAIVKRLKNKIGAAILTEWGFQQDLISVALNSENWGYESKHDRASYVDLTVVAQVHTFIGKKEHTLLPPFEAIPAFKKLGDGGLTPKQSQEVLRESHQQLQDIQALLSSETIPVLT